MINILFEGDGVLAAEKPAGLATIPESDPGKDSLRVLLEHQLQQRLYVVHRLDKDVSGVVLFARNPDAHRHLNWQFSQHKVDKTYLALVHGKPAEDEFEVNLPLREYGSGRVGVDSLRGKASVTGFLVLDRFRHYSLLEAHPVTGRRHQIRVHLYSSGHPVVGDLSYGDNLIQRSYDRLMLHSLAVVFETTAGHTVRVESQPSEQFRRVIDQSKRAD